MLSIVLVLLHVVGAAVIPCSWTQFRLRTLNAESIRLLEEMVRDLYFLGNIINPACV